MPQHHVELKDDKVYIHKLLSDGLPAQMPTMILDTLEAYDLANQIVRVVLMEEDENE